MSEQPLKPFYLHWSVGNSAKFYFEGVHCNAGIFYFSKVELHLTKLTLSAKLVTLLAKYYFESRVEVAIISLRLGS